MEIKYYGDNLRTQYIHINKNNQDLDVWDLSYTKYLVDLEIVEVLIEWNGAVTYDDQVVGITFPSRVRPLQEYQPESRNTVVVFTEPVQGLTNVTKKCYLGTADRPQLEVKDPREQVNLKKLRLGVDVIGSGSGALIDDWACLLKIRYVNESQ